MPTGWTRIGTPEDLKSLLAQPREFRKAVHDIVADAGAGLDDVFYETPDGPAYVLIHVPGKDEHARQVFENLDRTKLGPIQKRLYTVEELESGEAEPRQTEAASTAST